MKARLGFVSNSSSSSFVVAFPYIPHNIQDIIDLLFKRRTPGGNPAKKVAQTVFGDILGKMPLTKDEIIQELKSNYRYDIEDCPKFPSADASDAERKEFRKKYNAYNKKREKERINKATIAANKFIENNKDSVFFRFSYSDNGSGYFSALEHDGTFSDLPHIQISHH